MKTGIFNIYLEKVWASKIRFLYLFTFLFLLNIGGNDCYAQIKQLFTYLPFERPARLHKLVYRLGKDTTILFKSLDSLKVEAQLKGDDLLLWYAMIYKVNQQVVFRFKKPEQAIPFLKSKQADFEKSPFMVIKGIYYYHLSNLYYNSHDYKESFKYAFQSLRLFEEVGYQNIAEVSSYLSRFFEFYYFFADYKTALIYAQLAIKYNQFEIIGPAYALNNLGMTYLKMGDYPNAKRTFAKVVALATKLGRPTYIGISNGNHGNVLRLEGKYAEALPHLYKDVEINKEAFAVNTAFTCFYISDCLIELDSIEKGRKYMQLAIELYKSKSEANMMDKYHVLLYGVEAKYYQKSGQPYKALQYKDSLANVQDILAKTFDTSVLLRAESQMAAEKYLNKLDKMEQEKTIAILKRNLFIITIFIISIAVVYGLNQRRKREKALQEAEQKRAQEQIAHASAQLEQYIENIRSKNDLIDQMNDELLLHKKLPTDEVNNHIESLHQRVILTDEDWQQFKTLFEQVYPNFLKNLQGKYYDLSPAETRLLVLLKLNIRSKEMSYMLGVSIESLRKARYRLRRKLENLQADTNLVELIAQL